MNRETDTEVKSKLPQIARVPRIETAPGISAARGTDTTVRENAKTELRFQATHFSVNDRLLNFPQVKKLTGDSKTAWYDAMVRGEAPRPIKMGRQRVAWLESEIIAHINTRIAMRNAQMQGETGKMPTVTLLE